MIFCQKNKKTLFPGELNQNGWSIQQRNCRASDRIQEVRSSNQHVLVAPKMQASFLRNPLIVANLIVDQKTYKPKINSTLNNFVFDVFL